MERILVEFYDVDTMDNIFSLFSCRYDGVVYLCEAEDEDRLTRERGRLSRFVKQRFGIQPSFVVLRDGTIECAVECLRDLVRGDREYHFDITGGSPALIAAMGIFMATCRDSRVSLYQYDVMTGDLELCYPGDMGFTPESPLVPRLTIRETVELNGGAVRDSGNRRVTKELRTDVVTLWESVRDDIRSWNNFCTLSDDTPHGSSCIIKRVNDSTERVYRDITGRLHKAGLITGLYEERDSKGITASFVPQMCPDSLSLFDKGGNLLEMISYLTAIESGVFDECFVSVGLDWDSSTYTPGIDPVNELDLILARGYKPVFSSCKGTHVTNDYLYEIMTMTRHFGGRYACPMVISGPKNKPAICKRAGEMGIVLFDNVCALSADELTAKWRRRFAR